MRISFICCPFKTSFGAYGNSLKTAIEAGNGGQIQWVASNCGCGDPMETGRQFQIKQCDYFQMLIPLDYRSKTAWKRRVRGTARSFMIHLRARRYASMLNDPEVAHFQQVLNAYGSKAVFAWLNRPSSAVRVITVHELDADQLESPETNRTYNRADAIIVHCEEMRERLIQLAVQPEKIHVVLHGTDVPTPASDRARDGIVFYGGHKLMSGKGIETLFKAISILKKRRPGGVPALKIHGHYGSEAPAAAPRMAQEYGVADNIVWLNQIPEAEILPLYQQSLLIALPYTGSFAGLAGAFAAACQLPVVCTRKAGLPDHLGDSAIWIDENNAEQLAARIGELLDDDELRRRVGARLLKRAQDSLSWEVIADQTLKIYEAAARQKVTA
jgi:glycosyltransferase involved in cell wall biosynthesis